MKDRHPDPRPILHVVGALIVRSGRVLITQRRPGGSFGDHWEFPGGKVEEGEGDQDALRREIAEELGVEIEVHEQHSRALHDYPSFTLDFRVYRCRLRGEGEPRAIQVQDLRWIHPHEVALFRFPPADVPVLEKLVAEGF